MNNNVDFVNVVDGEPVPYTPKFFKNIQENMKLVFLIYFLVLLEITSALQFGKHKKSKRPKETKSSSKKASSKS